VSAVSAKLRLQSQVCRWLFPCVVLCSFSTFSFCKGFTPIPRFQGAGFSWVYGDFNGDNKVDLASSFPCSPLPCNGSIEVILGNGDGTLQRPTLIPVSGEAGFIAAGDFNGDHKLDLVMFTSVDWGSSNNSIRVFLGLGNGQFDAPTTTLTDDMDLFSFAIGDFNNDGRLDVLEVPASGNVWNTFTVFLGKGDGTFKTPVSTSAGGNNSRCSRVGDFNGDGKLDVVTWGTTVDLIHLGNGDGTFQAPLNTSLDPGFGCPAVADLNGDGKLDIAGGDSTGNIAVEYGNGNGTFGNVVHYKVPQFTTGVAVSVFVGDFNGDGKPDLIADDFTHNVFYVLKNKGNEKFAAPVGYTESVGHVSSAGIFPDLNSDGRADVIFGLPGANDFTLLGLSQPDGTLALPRAYTANGCLTADAVGLDVNLDGKTDLLVLTNSKSRKAGDVSLFKAGRGGVLSNPKLLSTRKSQPLTMALGDLNGDGHPDLVISNIFWLTVSLGTSSNFQEAMNFDIYPHAANSIAVGDFNGDGKLDLAINDDTANVPGEILFGNGDGTFHDGPSLPAGINSLAAADFNHDGKLDLVVATAAGTGVMLGKGDGTFQPIVSPQPSQAGALLVADFNGDGLPDVAGFGNTAPQTGVASIYLGNGDGTLQPAVNSVNSAPYYLSRAAAADLNGDGKIDLVITGVDSFFVLYGKGDGTFAQPARYDAGANPMTVVAGDFNGDGTLDLAIVNWGDTSVIIWPNNP